jgi:hypothetical protein
MIDPRIYQMNDAPIRREIFKQIFLKDLLQY